MPKWPIRVKLFAGLSLVIGMMLTLMGGSMFGLHSFHSSNLILTDQLRELGASSRLLKASIQIDSLRGDADTERAELQARVDEARKELQTYFDQLKANLSRGNRSDFGDELGLVFRVDEDLTAILRLLDPAGAHEPMLPATRRYLREHPDTEPAPAALADRITLLNKRVMSLPEILYRDFFEVLKVSKTQYEIEPPDRLDLRPGGDRDALRPGEPVPPLGPAPGPAAPARRPGGWRAGRSTIGSTSAPATRCRRWPRRSTT